MAALHGKRSNSDGVGGVRQAGMAAPTHPTRGNECERDDERDGDPSTGPGTVTTAELKAPTPSDEHSRRVCLCCAKWNVSTAPAIAGVEPRPLDAELPYTVLPTGPATGPATGSPRRDKKMVSDAIANATQARAQPHAYER